MSASREKQNRREKATSGLVSPKTAREAKQREEERRSAILYGTIGVIFCAIVIVSAVWNSNILSRLATAVTVDGEKYTAAQVDFYYHSAYMNFANYYGNYGYLSYFGLDTGSSLDSQEVNETAAAFLDIEAGGTWKDYFLEQGIQQMAAVQNGLKQAAAENFSFPESVEEQVQENLNALATGAGNHAVSERRYLQGMYGSAMTKGVYETELRRLLQYQSYITDYQDNLNYTEEELEAYYTEHANDFDQVSYELTTFQGSAESVTDSEGNQIDPTEEEQAAAREAAAENAAALYTALTGDAVDLEALKAAVTAETAKNADTTKEAAEATENAETADEAAEATENAETADEAAEATENAETADEAAEATENAEEAKTAEAEEAEEEETLKTVVVQTASLVDAADMGTLSNAYTNAYYQSQTEDTYESIHDYTSDVLADWLYDSSRKDGDTALLKSQVDCMVVVYHSRNRDEAKTVDVRHILIQPEDGTLSSDDEGYDEEQQTLMDAAREKAEDLYKQWKEGEATEDSFAALAEEESSDPGSSSNGGLYTEVYQGQMVQAFNDWCFDAGRKPGDTDIVETTYGFHIMYFVGDSLLKWQSDVSTAKKSADYQSFLDAFTEDAAIARKDFGMSFVS